MIQANELRHGNLIFGLYQNEDSDEIHKTECEFLGYNPFDKFLWVDSKESGIDEFIGFEPIPLTEEWLLKFGFHENKSNNSWQLDTKFGFSIWGRISHGFWLFIESDDCGNSIKYIHQLQNIYFALTGQELTLNDKL